MRMMPIEGARAHNPRVTHMVQIHGPLLRPDVCRIGATRVWPPISGTLPIRFIGADCKSVVPTIVSSTLTGPTKSFETRQAARWCVNAAKTHLTMGKISKANFGS